MDNEHFMKLAIEEAKKALEEGEKYPYGAVIVKDNQVISSTHNTVIQSIDPTSHSEVNAIRQATKKLGIPELEGCTLYSTCEPCPMCFAAAWWANISKIVYGISLADVRAIGGREIEVDAVYLNEKGGNKIKIESGFLKEECLRLFE